MARRQCEGCGGVVPDRMARQRGKDGKLLCEGCIGLKTPDWPVLSAMSDHMKAEYERRAAEALASISRVQRQGISFYDGPHTDAKGVPIGVYDQVQTPDGIGEVGALMPDTPYYQGKTVQVEMEGSPGYRTFGDPGDAERDYRYYRPEQVTILERHPNNLTLSSKTATRKTAHDSGDEALIHHCPFCFGGKVRYWTKEGLKSFAETVGTKQWVLTAEGGNRTGGYWVEAEIHDFGQQELWQVVVERNGTLMDIEATSDHVWLVKTKPLMTTEEHPSTIDIEVPTHDLAPGHYLSEVYEEGKDAPEGINESSVGWRVISVEPTGRTERTYCAEVPQTHTFALEGNIWVHNCGSGAVTGGSDGSVDCGYCKSVFTVQVQPKHPFAPQTIDGAPTPPPGMPAGEETEISSPVDLAVEEVEQPKDPAEDPSGAIPPEETQVPPQLRQSARATTAAGDGWVPKRNTYGDISWTKEQGDYVVDLWEVASRPGKFQWSGHHKETYNTIGGGEDWYDSKEEAQADAEDTLNRYSPSSHTSAREIACPMCVHKPNSQACSWCRGSKKIDADAVLSSSMLHPETKAASAPSMFFTEAGDVLDLDRYVDHLALRHADDRLTTLASVRKTKGAKAWPYMPGVPAAGHITSSGFWHPGPIEGCSKCPEDVQALKTETAAYADDPEVQAWRKARQNVTYTDGTRVQEGDRIRYHQAPGGLMAPGDWRYGTAEYMPGDDSGELVLKDPTNGRYYNLYGHVIERAGE